MRNLCQPVSNLLQSQVPRTPGTICGRTENMIKPRRLANYYHDATVAKQHYKIPQVTSSHFLNPFFKYCIQVRQTKVERQI